MQKSVHMVMTHAGTQVEHINLLKFFNFVPLYANTHFKISDEFRSVGQNIGIITGNYTYFKEASDVVNLYFDLWFDEYKDCNMTYIDDYQLVETK